MKPYQALLLFAIAAIPSVGRGQWAEITYEKEYNSQTLSGQVVVAGTDQKGAELEGVLVDVCDIDWKDCWKNSIASTKTDSEGNLSFPNLKSKKLYYLRLSLENMDPLRVKVRLKSRGPKGVTLRMVVAT